MTIQMLVVRPEKITSNKETWKVGDILVDQDNRQFRISDWLWQGKEVELIELEKEERNHADHIDGSVETSAAKIKAWPPAVTGKGEYYTHPHFGDVPYPNGRCG